MYSFIISLAAISQSQIEASTNNCQITIELEIKAIGTRHTPKHITKYQIKSLKNKIVNRV